MNKKKILSLLLVIAVLISAPIYSYSINLSKKWTLKDFQNQELKWQNCYGNFECSTLLAPVDYDKITSGVFHLKVIRYKATDQRHRLGALVVNPGGPGASAFDYAYNAENIVSAAIREKYDIVGFDERGVGQSDPIRCLTDKETDEMLAGPMIADTPENHRKMVENAKFFASKCKKAAGDKLTHLSTLESAKDMELLRLALNEPKLNYLGKSYGTYLGTLYASLYPSKVGKMILDGAIDPSISIQEKNLAQAKGFELALNSFLTKNKIRKIMISTLLRKIRQQPLLTESTRKLNDSLAILGVAFSLYDDKSGWPKLNFALRQALNGDGTPLLKLSDEYSGRSKSGMYLSNENQITQIINCIDWSTSTRFTQVSITSQKLVTEAPTFGPYLVNSELICKYLLSNVEKKNYEIYLFFPNPVMIIGTTRDPATPYEWAVALSKKFSNAILVTVDADGHTGQGRSNSCVESAADSYVLDSYSSSISVTCGPFGN